MKTIRGCALLLLAGVLVSCGGGGGGGGFVAQPTAIIDSGNAQAIAGAAIAGNLALANAVGSTGIGIASGPKGGGVRGAVSRILASGWTRTAILSISGDAARVEPAMAFGPETQDCGVSGTMRISGNVVDPNNLTPGDSINVTFINCDDGDGFVLDGTMKLTVTSFSGDVLGGAFLLVANATFTNLTVTSDTEGGTLNGTASLAFDTRDITQELTQLVTDSLRFASNGEVFQLNDYHLTGVALLDTGQYTLDVTGYLQDSSAFTGIVMLDSESVFTGDAGNYPSSGYLKISGASGSNMYVQAVDATQARLFIGLHIDPQTFDPYYDEIRDVTWSELTGGP